MFLSVIIESLNWEISTKNLITFKRDRMELRMKKVNIMGMYWEIQYLGGGYKKPIYWWDCLIMEPGQIANLRGSLTKKKRECFLGKGGRYANPHYP